MRDLIISVKEARKILGKSAHDLTDDEIEKIIIDLEALARFTLKGIQDGSIKSPPPVS